MKAFDWTVVAEEVHQRARLVAAACEGGAGPNEGLVDALDDIGKLNMDAGDRPELHGDLEGPVRRLQAAAQEAKAHLQTGDRDRARHVLEAEVGGFQIATAGTLSERTEATAEERLARQVSSSGMGAGNAAGAAARQETLQVLLRDITPRQAPEPTTSTVPPVRRTSSGSDGPEPAPERPVAQQERATVDADERTANLPEWWKKDMDGRGRVLIRGVEDLQALMADTGISREELQHYNPFTAHTIGKVLDDPESPRHSGPYGFLGWVYVGPPKDERIRRMPAYRKAAEGPPPDPAA